MNSIVFLILRRMRVPLLLLSAVYCIATLGLTIIPGLDDEGNVWYMDFFHAFYFVTFMGTTIGFGEIPYPFTDAQRFWALIFIYITVATWIYAIGALINLLQNDTLKKALVQYQFSRQVSQIREPFFLICGYGDTGSRLTDSLLRRLTLATVVDIKQDRLDALTLTDYPLHVPGLCANAADPENLILAGVTHSHCRGVVALTNDNAANLHIAITSKVLNPGIQVICRADSHEVEANLASFGTDHIVDPFDTFASLLGLAIHMPHQYLLNRWFHTEPDEPLQELVELPKGKWILCGYGRFGRAVYKEMTRHGFEVQVIEPNRQPGQPHNTIHGLGTAAEPLREAGVETAVGIVAGADDDSNNLSIIVTARELNPDLFVVARQAQHFNRELYDASSAELVMAPSGVLVNKIRTLLTNPLADDFLSLARAHDNSWAEALITRLRAISPAVLPEIWAVTIDGESSPAVINAISQGWTIQLRHLLMDHSDRSRSITAIPLLYSSVNGAFCMPDSDTVCSPGDRLLFAGSAHTQQKMQWNLLNDAVLLYLATGNTPPQTLVGRWFANRFGRTADSST